jgi:hypothetical protein
MRESYHGKIAEIWRIRGPVFWALTKDEKNPGISPGVAVFVGLGALLAVGLIWGGYKGASR